MDTHLILNLWKLGFREFCSCKLYIRAVIDQTEFCLHEMLLIKVPAL